MKQALQILSLSIFFYFIQATSAHGQWEEVNTVYGGNPMLGITETTNKIAGFGSTGIYLANKNTLFWEEVTLFEQTPIYGIAASNEMIVVAYQVYTENLYSLYVRISFDEGATWAPEAMVSESWGGELKIAIVNQQIVFAGYFNGINCIRKSQDLGQTWTTESLPSDVQYVNRILDVNDSHIIYEVSNSTNTGTVFSYSVENNSWHVIPNTTEYSFLLKAQILNDRIYTAVENIGSFNIYSSALDGSDMEILYTNSDYITIQNFFEVNGKLVFLIVDFSTPSNAVKVYSSINNGQTFTFQYNFLYPYTMNLNNIYPLESGEFVVGGWSLYLFNNDLLNYQQIINGFKLEGIDHIASTNNTLYVSKNETAFARSTNNGESFEDASSITEIPCGRICASGDSLCFIDYDNFYYDYKFVRSLDNGLTFESIQINNVPIGYEFQENGLAILDNKLFLLQTNNNSEVLLLTSDDFGETWVEISTPTESSAIIEVVNGALYFYGEDLYRYDFSNNTWTDLNSPVVNEDNNSLVECKIRRMGNNIWIANENSNHCVLTSDGVTYIMPEIDIQDVTQIGNIIYALSEQFIYASSDFGLSWLSTGVIKPESNKITSHNGELLAYGGANSSIWRMNSLQFVTGMVYYDENSNGNFDEGEIGIPNILIHSQNSESYSMSSSTGSFMLNFNGILDQITVETNNPNFVASPSNITVSGDEYLLIGISTIGNVSDLLTDAILLSPFRPGFSTNVNVVVINFGNVEQGGELTFNLPSQATFVNATVAPTSQTANSITWTIDSLNTFETRIINLQLLTNSTAVLGDTAVFTINLNAEISDDHLENNSLTNASIIVGAYDPNDKTCYRGELVTPTQLSNNNEFEYLIRFQNTGTFYAENVVIKDTISSYFDLSTMRIIASSDTMNVTFGENNLVNFNFPLIFLPDSTSNEPESHGFVKYAIRTKPNLELGTVLKNTAYIYFDFNEPIITNTSETLYDLPSNIFVNSERNAIVFPNPTQGWLKLIEYNDQTIQVTITDLSGKVVAIKSCSNGDLDLSELNAGIYLGVIQGNTGQEVQRFKVVKM